MKIKGFLLSVFTLMLMVVGAVLAGQQDFQLYNRTGVDIAEVYVSPSGEESWEENVMGADNLLNGADIHITFDREEEAELWDIKIVSTDGDSLEWSEINLITATEVVLEDNGVARIKE